MAGAADRVREAALDLFADRGFHGVGIRQLADRAGLSSASLYHYMGTKEDLLAAIMRECLGRLLRDAEAAAAAHADPVARVEALVRAHVVSHAERPRETRVVDGELAALSGGPRAEVVALRDSYERVWQDAIDAGAAAGAFTVGSPAVARRALLEMCSGVARWYDAAGPISLEELADLYAAMARQLLGVRPADGPPDGPGHAPDDD
ncbi:TetR/AcrR family transcriptional regulator [Nocardioides marmotae]|uniref:TetR/AcrR family transcriptional regulator n=1 Tax=Nocardioides marmotae TaxID=2663857 RepID=UPI0012B66814|nr:TetR/AcrR family transcriptional regulator [Nocardioides marmotae]MBC9733892.1 TetR/AcrR family transcriptional regulator [Nocardioides marmotae]MTB84996.1 TetR family transcriptional regulator [Nocardioides marmotae]